MISGLLAKSTALFELATRMEDWRNGFESEAIKPGVGVRSHHGITVRRVSAAYSVFLCPWVQVLNVSQGVFHIGRHRKFGYCQGRWSLEMNLTYNGVRFIARRYLTRCDL